MVFSIGKWTVEDGIYRLMSCPPGHQLVNAINGKFSHDIQQCLPCQQSEYIVSSNNSDFSCQPCPVGAVCDGNSLHGLVPGSKWQVDLDLGRYFLLSCPAGYELLGGTYDSQRCALCPAGRYCTGGIAASAPCPDSTFAQQGANASISCLPAVLVQVSVVMAMEQAGFTDQAQHKFVAAVADSCEVSLEKIYIWSVSSTRRASNGSSESVQVVVNIASKDLGSATYLLGKLSKATLEAQLAWQGLPAAISLAASILEPAVATSPFQATPIIAGIVVGFAVLILAVVMVLRGLSPGADEDPLLGRISEIRRELGITLRDGYLMRPERIPLWTRISLGLQRRSLIELKRGHLEAAALLSLEQDFSLEAFDELCFLLRIEMPMEGWTRINGGVDARGARYNALRLWILDLSKKMLSCQEMVQCSLEVKIPTGRAATLGGVSELRRELEAVGKLKFRFFADRVSKAMIWSEDGGSLFRELQRLAGLEMERIAGRCDARYAALCGEDKGRDLLAYNPLADPSAQIVRQDHSEVRTIPTALRMREKQRDSEARCPCAADAVRSYRLRARPP